jgi:hypothetical protein
LCLHVYAVSVICVRMFMLCLLFVFACLCSICYLCLHVYALSVICVCMFMLYLLFATRLLTQHVYKQENWINPIIIIIIIIITYFSPWNISVF